MARSMAPPPPCRARVSYHFGPGGQDLELATRGAHLPAAAVIGLDRHVRRVSLDVNRQQRQRVIGGHLAKPCQRRRTE